MKQSYKKLRDYHSEGSGIRVEEVEWCSVRAAILHEASNDVHFTKTERSALVLTLDGTIKHFTKMEGVFDNTASNPGEICFIPKDVDVRLSWENHCELQDSIVLDFDTSLFAAYAPELLSGNFEQGHLIPKNFERCTDLEYLMRVLGQEVASQGKRGLIFAESAIRLVAIQIAKSAWTHPAALTNDRTRTDARARRAIDFIETNYGSDVSLLEIGTAAGLSVTQLTQVFLQATGETPYAYVISRRLKQAVHLLRNSDLPIAHIALDVGFADQAHLTRTFQRRFSKTPKMVRDGC
jgi:AraC-like DNA-binding protein